MGKFTGKPQDSETFFEYGNTREGPIEPAGTPGGATVGP